MEKGRLLGIVTVETDSTQDDRMARAVVHVSINNFSI